MGVEAAHRKSDRSAVSVLSIQTNGTWIRTRNPPLLLSGFFIVSENFFLKMFCLREIYYGLEYLSALGNQSITHTTF